MFPALCRFGRGVFCLAAGLSDVQFPFQGFLQDAGKVDVGGFGFLVSQEGMDSVFLTARLSRGA